MNVLYTAFIGLTGYHHYTCNDDRLAFMFATSWGLAGVGWMVDTFLFFLARHGRMYSIIRRIYTLMYMKFIYTMFDFFVLKYVLYFYPMFFCVSSIVLPLYIAGYMEWYCVIAFIIALTVNADAELKRTNDFQSANYILFTWSIVMIVGYVIGYAPSIDKTSFHEIIPWICVASIITTVTYIVYKNI